MSHWLADRPGQVGRGPVVVVYGTRPEAIKLISVIEALRARGAWVQVICTGQHRELLVGLVEGAEADFDLGLMQNRQTPSEFLARAMASLEPFIASDTKLVLVQGDTASAFAGALAAFHRQVPIGHIEAGLRTYDFAAPFPEEGYRQMIDRIATRLYAPTDEAARNLVREGREDWVLTGNTGIDAALNVVEKNLGKSAVGEGQFVLATLHRREADGAPAEAVCRALARLAGHVKVVLPVHPNAMARRLLEGSSVQLIEPLNYPDLIQTLRRAACVITDSGGIQEEAATFGVPMLITRTKTERQEAVRVGAARLVGYDEDLILSSALPLLAPVGPKNDVYNCLAVYTTYYGDGKAGDRIAKDILQ